MSSDEDSKLSDVKAKAKEVLGHVTGDREVEAAGRAEAEADGTPDEAIVQEKVEEVRRDHHDTGPPTEH